MTQELIYQKSLDEELEEDIGLKDYEVDQIKLKSKIYFGSRTVDADIKYAKKIMNIFSIGNIFPLFYITYRALISFLSAF